MASRHPTVQPRSYSIFVLLVVSVLLLASCGGKAATANAPILASPTPTAELPTPTLESVPATSQIIVDTATPIPPSPTPQETLATATAVIVSPTPQAVATSAPAAGSIVFTPGTTATVVQGSLQPGQVMTYTLDGGQSQPMILIMDSPSNDVTLGVFDYAGNMVLDPANKWTNWQAVLPKTERYTIQVTGGAVLESFTLTVKVAQLVNFASGTSSITLNGTTVNGYLYDYALNCSAGQTMTASLNVPSSTATLDIYGLATGSTLLLASAKASTWTGVLPETQDYVIEVVPNNGQVVNYALTVSCTGVAVSAPSPAATVVALPPSNGGNLTFAPHTTAADVQGTIGPGQVVSYTVQASQYQPLILVVDSPNKDVFLGVLYPDGTTMLSPTKQWTYWQWKIPQTGLYKIQLYGGSTLEKYELTVKLPEIVLFAPGAFSITLNGDTNLGFVRSYAFYLNFGQELTVSLNVSSDKAYLDVFGLETGSLLSYMSKASTWTKVLPETEMYIIEVLPRGGYLVSYSLTVSVSK